MANNLLFCKEFSLSFFFFPFLNDICTCNCVLDFVNACIRIFILFTYVSTFVMLHICNFPIDLYFLSIDYCRCKCYFYCPRILSFESNKNHAIISFIQSLRNSTSDNYLSLLLKTIAHMYM